MSIDKTLNELFDAERAAAAAEEKLLSAKPKELVPLLVASVDAAFALRDGDEATLRLRRLAMLLGEIEGQETADALVRVLSAEDPGVRQIAGEELEERAYDRYAEFARAVDRALDRGTEINALLELPYIIAQVGEPSALLLLRRFLAHADAEVVAEAIGALVELGDPEAVRGLKNYVGDQRAVSIADEGDEDAQATIGELARDAIEALERLED